MAIKRGVSLYSYQQAQFFKEMDWKDMIVEVHDTLKADGIEIIDEAKLAEPKTKLLNEKLIACGLKNSLFIDGKEVDTNFALASRNIIGVDVLPTVGANVYDILRKEKLVLTKDAVVCLGERLK